MSPGSLSRPDTVERAAFEVEEVVPAIRVVGLRKTFRIPHEARATVRDYVVHPLRRTTYELQTALDDVSFEVPRGDFFGVIGRNGSGKSTLLKVVSGIYGADAGTVEITGKLSPFIELGVGFNPELSARDNVVVNGTLLGLSRQEIAERFDDIIAFGELERFVDQKLKNFSSGMQLRLAYSIAIQVPFDILLLDEVLAVGDQNFQEKCFATFEEMRQDGKTVVLVTHDLRAVARFCDQALLLRDGVVEGIGAPAEVSELYLDQERQRSVTSRGRRRAPSGDGCEGENDGKDRPSLADEGELTRVLEARWRALTTEDVAEMSPADVHEILRMQQSLLEERRRDLDGLRNAFDALDRDAEHLWLIADALTKWHYGDALLPPEHLRFGKRPTKLNFLAQGVAAAERVFEILGPAPPGQVLEWGCGSGRVARWLVAQPEWNQNYAGCDENVDAVRWLTTNLGVDAVVAPRDPPLPFADESFAGVFTFTMLTRIDPRHHPQWYRELSRVLRPGGSLLVVTQGPTLVPPGVRNGHSLGQEFETQGWAFADTKPVGAAFVSETFTRAAAPENLEVVEYRPEGHGSADLYVLRRSG